MQENISNQDLLNNAIQAASNSNSLNRAFSLYEVGKYEEALTEFEKELKQNSNSSEIITNIGNCHFKLNAIDKALQYWERAISLDPNSSNAMISAGNARYAQGKTEKAIYAWHLATTVEPENPNLNLNLGSAYKKIDNRFMSIKYFEKFLKYSDNEDLKTETKIHSAISTLRSYADSYVKEATFQYQEGDFKRAVELYQKSIATYPDQPKTAYFLGKVYYSAECYNNALKYFQAALLADPFNKLGSLDIAYSYEHLKDWVNAYCYYKRAIERYDSNPKVQSAALNRLGETKSNIPDIPTATTEILARAKENEQKCKIFEAVCEYENYLYLSEESNKEIKEKIKIYNSYLNPEPYVFNFLLQKFDNAVAKNDMATVKELGYRALKINPKANNETSHIRAVLRNAGKMAL